MAEIVATVKVKLTNMGASDGNDPILNESDAAQVVKEFIEDNGTEVIGEIKVENETKYDEEDENED